MNKKLLIADSEDEDSEIEFSEGSDYKDDWLCPWLCSKF